MLELQRLSKLALFILGLAGSSLACKSNSEGDRADAGDAASTVAHPADEASITRARAMTKAFATQLQATLLSAIEASGPAQAIVVCKNDAPQIAEQQAGEGWTLGRTALRVRNPANAPTPWQRAVIEDWRTKIEAGSVDDVATLEWSEVVDGQLRYMRAIPLGGVCLTCHGPAEQIPLEVQAALTEHYPSDEATGFRVGDLRGAFVVLGPA